jgi:hypothetical protein
VASLLADFEEATGTAVQKVAVGRLDIGTMEEPDRSQLGGVTLVITV